MIGAPFFRNTRGVVAAIAVAVVPAIVGVVHPAIDRLAAADARLVDATLALDADRVALARLRAFPALRRRYRAEIGSVDFRSADAVLVADFLASVVRDAARRDVTIVSLTADQHGPPGAPTTTFREVPLVLTEEGRYTDILATLDSLSHAREIVRIETIDIARAGDGSLPRRDVRVVMALRLLRLDRDPAAGSPRRDA